MKAYVINLPRSADRRAHIIRELAKTELAYEVVAAADGQSLDLGDARLVDQQAVRGNALALGAGSAGALGCALSHLWVYERMAASGEPWAVVLEDDASLAPDVATVASATAEALRPGDVALLYCGVRGLSGPLRVQKRLSAPLPGNRRLLLALDHHAPTGTVGYVITRLAAERLANMVLPVRVAADAWGVFVEWGAIRHIWCVLPMPVVPAPQFRSLIDFYEPGSLKARLRSGVAALPLVKQALDYRRSRRLERWGWAGNLDVVEV